MLFNGVMPLATCVATTHEKHRPFRVDAMIPDPLFTSTHAITIDALPEQVCGSLCEDGPPLAGSISLVHGHLVSAASSSNAHTRCWRAFRGRYSSASPRSVTA